MPRLPVGALYMLRQGYRRRAPASTSTAHFISSSLYPPLGSCDHSLPRYLTIATGFFGVAVPVRPCLPLRLLPSTGYPSSVQTEHVLERFRHTCSSLSFPLAIATVSSSDHLVPLPYRSTAEDSWDGRSSSQHVVIAAASTRQHDTVS